MVKRGEVWQVNLNLIQGHEQQGSRPCLIVSPDSMNQALGTVIVLPLTSKAKSWPTRVDVIFDAVPGQVICEQIRTVSKERFSRQLGKLALSEMVQVKLVLKQMFFD